MNSQSYRSLESLHRAFINTFLTIPFGVDSIIIIIIIIILQIRIQRLREFN